MDGTCRKHGEMRNAYGIFVENPERNRPVGRPRQRCGDNIRMDLVSQHLEKR